MNLSPHLISDARLIAEHSLTPVYDPVLVALSFLLAVFASFETLRLVGHLRTTPDPGRQPRLVAVAGLTFGGGVWSMHFTAMLAATFPVTVTWSPGLTFLSLAIPVAVSALSFYWMRLRIISTRRLVGSGVVTGLGIALMHYLGMAAMQAPVTVAYRTDLFVLSIAIAVGAATAAIWFAKYFSDESLPEPSVSVGIGTGVLMAVAIAGMHYTGMAAMVVTENNNASFTHSFTLDPPIVATAVAVTLLILLTTTHVVISADGRSSGTTRLAMLPLLMIAVAAGAASIAVAILYDAAIRTERDRLLQIIGVQGALIDAVAAFDEDYSANDVSGGATAATLSQLRDAHRRFPGFGKTGELYLAAEHNSAIDYVVPLRYELPAGEHADRPMQLALTGATGSTIAPDYRGEPVLAAYRPLTSLGLGMVIKVDLAELRTPFINAGLLAAGATLFLTLMGVVIYGRLSSPLVRELDEKARLEVELEVGRAVQEGLLPTSVPDYPTVRGAAQNLPARYVSGDFYDFVDLRDGAFAMIIGDVSGKGVSAALLMARMISELRNALAQNRDPAGVLAAANEAVLKTASQGMFVTCCCVVVDAPARAVAAANAGHLPLLLAAANNEPGAVIEPSGPPLGVLEEPGYLSEQLQFRPGDYLVGYTDGVPEARNGAGEEFGAARLWQALSRPAGDATTVVAEVLTSVQQFSGAAPQSDDLTIIGLEWR